ncbi:MAG: PqqD family protein [Candidatus Promineifilaceae bacterium]
MSEEAALPRVAPDIVWRLLDDNAVVVSPREGEVRVLNSVGTAVWQLLIDDQDVAAIEAFLGANFNVSPEQAHEDLVVFLDELTDRGILVRDSVAS